MANKPANTAQRKWMSDISEWAYDTLGYLFPDYLEEGFQLHHVLGRSAKHNKISIGHWFILPIPFDLHDVSSNHPLNITHHKHCFTGTYGSQRRMFERMCNSMENQGYTIPPNDAYYSILDTRA